MGALGYIIAVILCALIVKFYEWWQNRKEEKETQRMIK